MTERGAGSFLGAPARLRLLIARRVIDALLVRGVVAALAMLVAACADLAPIELGTCGNAVLEAGEDCDGSADAALGTDLRCAGSTSEPACRYVCQEGAACPAGWDCGPDSVCRHASGRFRDGPSIDGWTPDSFASVDFNQDGVVDLVGAFPGGVEFMRGEPEGFAAVGTVATTPVTGPIAEGDIDDDGYGDVILPTAEGVAFVRGQANSVPLAVAWASVSVPGADLTFVPMETDALGGASLILVLAGPGPLQMQLYQPDALPLGRGLAVPEASAADVVGDVVHADLDANPSTGEVVVALRDRPELVFVDIRYNDFISKFEMSLRTRPAGLEVSAPCTDQRCTDRREGMRVAAGAVAADVDGDLDDDLLVSVRDDADRDAVVVLLNAGDATFAEPYVDARFDALVTNAATEPGATPRWPLLVVDLDGDGVADVVTGDGVFLTVDDGDGETRFELVRPSGSAEPWTVARALDADGDTDTDVVATREGSRVVDFLLCGHAGKSCHDDQVFRGVRIPTSRPVGPLCTGFFSGTDVEDVALVERASESSSDDVVSLIRGARTGPSQVEQQARIHGVIDVVTGESYGFGTQVADGYADLIVTTRDRDDVAAYGVLQGGQSGHLASPFVLPNGSLGNLGSAAPTSIALGDFRGAGLGAADVAIVATTTFQVPLAFWAQGAEGAALQPLRPGTSLAAAFGNGVDSTCATARAGDIDGDGRDELVVVSASARCSTPTSPKVAVGRVDADGAFVFEASDLALDGAVDPPALALADFDGDGAPETIFGTSGALHVFTSASSFAQAPPRIELPSAEPIVDMTAVARGDGARGGGRFAVLTRSSLMVVAPGSAIVTLPIAKGRALATADYDGDGLGDLFVLTDDGVHAFVTVPDDALGGRE